MLRGLRLAAIVLLCAPYALALAQGISNLLKNPPVPETIPISEMPAEFRAVDILTSASDFMQAMRTSMSFGGGSNQKDAYDAYQYSQTSWTDGKTIGTEVGEFLITYKLSLGSYGGGNASKLNDTLRLTLVRKDSIIEISPRSDLTKARLLELVFSQAQVERQGTASKTTALSNLKQLTLGMIMYTSDYDDVYPYVQDSKSAFAVTAPYLKNNSLAASLNPAGSRILMNMAIAGVEASAIDLPAETILYFDEKPWPGGEHLVAFADGHAKFVDEEGWKKCEATLHLKMKRKTKPLPAEYWKKLNYPGIGAF